MRMFTLYFITVFAGKNKMNIFGWGSGLLVFLFPIDSCFRASLLEIGVVAHSDSSTWDTWAWRILEVSLSSVSSFKSAYVV